MLLILLLKVATLALSIGVLAGGGGEGGLQPPQSLGNSDFLSRKRNLGKASFKRSLCFYFRRDTYFLFNLKSA